jgi:LacI family transcriptional regulator
MSDVARLARVSTSTVSHVINETRFVDPITTERVRAAIDELGYRHNHLARSVARGGRTQSIGVAMSARSNPYFGEVISAIDMAATARGSTILIGETADDSAREIRLIDSLLQRRVDGIILAPGPDARELTLPLLAKAATPTVLVDRLHDGSRFDQIGTDNVEPVARLIDHLSRVHGHTRIGFISGLRGLGTTDERLAGYRMGIARNRVEVDPALICDGGSSREGGTAAMAELIDLRDRPGAVVTGNNAMTVGALHALAARGVRVPDEVAVASFDDLEWAPLLASPLTAIAQDWMTIGTRAVEILMRRLDASHEPLVYERVPTSLVIRNSCGCSGTQKTVAIKVRGRPARSR